MYKAILTACTVGATLVRAAPGSTPSLPLSTQQDVSNKTGNFSYFNSVDVGYRMIQQTIPTEGIEAISFWPEVDDTTREIKGAAGKMSITVRVAEKQPTEYFECVSDSRGHWSARKDICDFVDPDQSPPNSSQLLDFQKVKQSGIDPGVAYDILFDDPTVKSRGFVRSEIARSQYVSLLVLPAVDFVPSDLVGQTAYLFGLQSEMKGNIEIFVTLDRVVRILKDQAPTDIKTFFQSVDTIIDLSTKAKPAITLDGIASAEFSFGYANDSILYQYAGFVQVYFRPTDNGTMSYWCLSDRWGRWEADFEKSCHIGGWLQPPVPTVDFARVKEANFTPDGAWNLMLKDPQVQALKIDPTEIFTSPSVKLGVMDADPEYPSDIVGKTAYTFSFNYKKDDVFHPCDAAVTVDNKVYVAKDIEPPASVAVS